MKIFSAQSELESRISEWVEYFNDRRYHEAIKNIIPADKYYGRDLEVLINREKVRKQTMKLRRKLNVGMSNPPGHFVVFNKL